MKLPWLDNENDLIVEDYFSMLRAELQKEPYNKAAHRRALMPKLNNRSEGSVEFKHQNISAILKGAGEIWISGYKPAFNFQNSLIDAVARYLALSKFSSDTTRPRRSRAVSDGPGLYVGPAPTLSNQPPPDELEQMTAVAHRFDAAGRDERNTALGKAGEAIVFEHERMALMQAGRHQLADKVRWVSQEDGDGAGYDIASFFPDGRRRLVEVKTTNGWERTPFFISRNELAVAEDRREEWCLFRVWNLSSEPKAFELYPPLDRHVSLTATTFQASFH